MGDRLTMLLWLPFVTASLVATLVVLGALFTDLIQGVRSAAKRMPGRSTLLGFVNLLFLSVLVAALSAIGEGGLLQLIALILLALLAIATTFGLSAVATLIGEGLVPDASPTRQAVWGAIAMLTACLTPMLGWFALFPYLALRGLGALIIHLFTR